MPHIDNTYIKSKNGKMQLLTFFLAGFGMYIFYLPMMLISAVLGVKKNRRFRVKKIFLYFLSIYMLFLVSLFSIGWERMSISSPFNLFIVITICSIYLGYCIQSSGSEKKVELITAYILGYFLQNIIIVIYTFSLGDGYGYGNLFNPFTEQKINSPSVSNVMALSMSMFLFYLFNKDKMKLIYSLPASMLIISAAFFLSGRTFFFISGIVFVLLSIKYMSLQTIVKMAILALFAYLTFSFLVPDSIESYLDFTLNRISEGVESNRFKHWMYGVDVFGNYPFGGFEISKTIENTKWMHNIFLDSAMIGGWIPMFSLILFTLSSFFIYFLRLKTRDRYFGFILFLVSLLIMMQDVIIEGEYRTLIVYFMASILITERAEST